MLYAQMKRAYENAQNMEKLAPNVYELFLRGEYTRLKSSEYNSLLTYSTWLLDGYNGGVSFYDLSNAVESGTSVTGPLAVSPQYKEFLEAEHRDEETLKIAQDIKSAINFLKWHCQQVSHVAKKYHEYLALRDSNFLEASLTLFDLKDKADATLHEIKLFFHRNLFFLQHYFSETGFWKFPAFEPPNCASQGSCKNFSELLEKFGQFGPRTQELHTVYQFLTERHRAHINYKQYLKKIHDEGNSDLFHASLLLLELPANSIGIKPDKIEQRLRIYKIFLCDETSFFCSSAENIEDSKIKRTLSAAALFLHNNPNLKKYNDKREAFIKRLTVGSEIPDIKVAAKKRRGSLLLNNNNNEVVALLNDVDEAEKFLSTDLDFLVDPNNEMQKLSNLLAKVKLNFHLFFSMEECVEDLQKNITLICDNIKAIKKTNLDASQKIDGIYIYKNTDRKLKILCEYEKNISEYNLFIQDFCTEKISDDESDFLKHCQQSKNFQIKEKAEEIHRLIIDENEFDYKKKRVGRPVLESLELLAETLELVKIEIEVTNEVKLHQDFVMRMQEKLSYFVLKINEIDHDFVKDFSQCEEDIETFNAEHIFRLNMSLIDKHADSVDPLTQGCSNNIYHALKVIEKLNSRKIEFENQLDFIRKHIILSAAEMRSENIKPCVQEFENDKKLQLNKIEEWLHYFDNIDDFFDIDKEMRNVEKFCENAVHWLESVSQKICFDPKVLEFLEALSQEDININIKTRISKIFKIKNEIVDKFNSEKNIILEKITRLKDKVSCEKNMRKIEEKVANNSRSLNKLISTHHSQTRLLQSNIEKISTDVASKTYSVEKTLIDMQDCGNMIKEGMDKAYNFALPDKITEEEKASVNAIVLDEHHLRMKERGQNIQSSLENLNTHVVAKIKNDIINMLEGERNQLEHTIESCQEIWEREAHKNIKNYKNRFKICSNEERQDSAGNFIIMINAVKNHPPLKRIEILLEYIRREKQYVQKDHKKGMMYCLLTCIGIDRQKGSRLYRLFDKEEKQLKILYAQAVEKANRDIDPNVASTSQAVPTAATSLVALPLLFKSFVENTQNLKHKEALLQESLESKSPSFNSPIR